ncbi:hypothetical protein BDB00DRAFT_791973 [Zychaea mexicana]|uniref:uncharacterized protein n=1 Tax=Zychaea mexicana TaxID=64656 RepID=UPI0022FDD1BC|nr:uncharacterized protein BDB00DRAFT_791973 [Zychaea mexicana]KAI9488332.1 hypothetical protein BDB00DRAFT_791973 [Zychaea mexicana]
MPFSATLASNSNDDTINTAPGKRRRRMSDSHLLHRISSKQPRYATPVISAATRRSSSPAPPPPPLVEPLSPITTNTNNNDAMPDKRNNTVLAESLIKVTPEKETEQMKRSQDMLEFLREKRLEREQLLIEQERTRRIRAKAELVKNLMEAGFTKQEIAEQLQFL